LQRGIIKNSLCIGFDGALANWVGTLISHEQKIVIFGKPSIAVEAIQRLLRIGYTNILGYSEFPI
jgi:hypothetical protein